METCVTDVVWRDFNGRRSCVYGRRGSEFYCAGCEERKSALAFSVWGECVFIADDVLGRWKAICCAGGGIEVIWIWGVGRKRAAGDCCPPAAASQPSRIVSLPGSICSHCT